MTRMKISRVKKIALLATALLLFSNVTNAANRYGQSYIDAWTGLGYSSFLHQIPNTSVPGNVGGLLGFGYEWRYKKKLILMTGAELDFINSTTRLSNFSIPATMTYNDGNGDIESWDYTFAFDKYRERQHSGYLSVPLMVGYIINKKFYVMGGGLIGLNLYGNYKTKTTITTTVQDMKAIDPYTNMPNHTLTTYDYTTDKSALDFGTDIMGSLEFGMIIDKWIPKRFSTITIGKTMPLTYRAGVFVDYGVNNVNLNPTVLSLAGTYNNETERLPLNSILATTSAANYNVNSLLVGVKLTISMGLTKKKVTRELKTRSPRPTKIKPPVFYLQAKDSTTNKPIDANVSMVKLTNSDTVFTAITDVSKGMTKRQMVSNAFVVTVSKSGYFDYVDTVYTVNNDTLHVLLRPIPKKQPIILEDLYFDFDKSTIKYQESEATLQYLYNLLKKNPTMTIKITGHTDNKGSEAYNKRLSTDRAKAVYDDMVRRGIDPSRMTWEGKGFSEPIDTNDTDEGRAHNRRVEFMIMSE